MKGRKMKRLVLLLGSVGAVSFAQAEFVIDRSAMSEKYWEIWNEPDLDRDDSTNKRCWGGTKAEYFDFYEIAAKHLKECFPHLKIGGPAIAGRRDWTEDFLTEMKKRNAPLDFFSWHIYAVKPEQIVERSEQVKALLLK